MTLGDDKSAAVPCAQRHLRIEEYTYLLPDEKVALYPLSERDASKLLVYKDGESKESIFKNICDFLPSKTFLVMNDTRVVHARMVFYNEKGARIEIFCLQPEKPAEIALAFGSKGEVEFRCLVGNNRKWKDGKLSMIFSCGDKEETVFAERIDRIDDTFIIRFTYPTEMSFSEVLEVVGKVPLPPYINRKAEEEDKERYQTVFAHYDGSVAAPTAGLHFTPKLLLDLDSKGIKKTYVTLHVGAGTFKPVKTEEVGEHEMHKEYISVSKNTIKSILSAIEADNAIIPVGTTSMRTLESLYWWGVLLIDGKEFKKDFQLEQWLAYETYSGGLPYKPVDALKTLCKYMESNERESIQGYTSLMIAPGYTFAFCKGIITNFHQPQSTLLLLVSALIGDKWKGLYDYALRHDFRFLSYGDSCLFLK